MHKGTVYPYIDVTPGGDFTAPFKQPNYAEKW